jgi:hypothetical protein
MYYCMHIVLTRLIGPSSRPTTSLKIGSAGNQTRDLRICSQKPWPLDHRGGRLLLHAREKYTIELQGLWLFVLFHSDTLQKPGCHNNYNNSVLTVSTFTPSLPGHNDTLLLCYELGTVLHGLPLLRTTRAWRNSTVSLTCSTSSLKPAITLNMRWKCWQTFLAVRGRVVAEALCYKPEGRGFQTQWDELIF